MRATLLTLAALAAALAGCRQKQAAGAIPRQRFVLANADLRSIPDTAPKGDSLRKAALKKHRVTEADLRRFVTVHGRSPEYLAEVWREIADSVQTRYDRSFPSRAEREAGGRVGPDAVPIPATLPGAVPIDRPPGVRKPPPPPDQPPPPVTDAPRPMVRGTLPPPVRRPPVGGPPDTHGPMTRPGQRPMVPLDTLERRRVGARRRSPTTSHAETREPRRDSPASPRLRVSARGGVFFFRGTVSP